MGPPDDSPFDYATLFGVERRRLLELLDALAEAQWRLPTPCPAWNVHELCCHLAGDDISVLSRHRDGHHGTVPPPDVDEHGFIAWLDELQLEWVDAARRMSPRVVRDLLAWTGPQLVEMFRVHDRRARTASVTWAGTAPVPVWLDQARELSEYWIHRQQLLQALELPSDLRADVAAAVLDAFRWAYPFRLAERLPDRDGAVVIAVDGSVSTTWTLVGSHHEHWDFVAHTDAPVIARLAMTTEKAWRLLTNNLPAQDQATLDATGDPAVVETLLGTRAIIGEPV